MSCHFFSCFLFTWSRKGCLFKDFRSCKNYQLANLFPARAVALGCVYEALNEKGLTVKEDIAEWVDHISSGKVDLEDFEEVTLEIQKH